jgi:hypothetical protein
MRSNLQQSNGLDVIFEFTRQQFLSEMRSKTLQRVFSIIDPAKWAPQVTKM